MIATVNNTQIATGAGEGFFGFRPVASPDFEHGTLTLDLNVKETSAAPSGVAGGGTIAAKR